jgi:hypothetical protein
MYIRPGQMRNNGLCIDNVDSLLHCFVTCIVHYMFSVCVRSECQCEGVGEWMCVLVCVCVCVTLTPNMHHAIQYTMSSTYRFIPFVVVEGRVKPIHVHTCFVRMHCLHVCAYVQTHCRIMDFMTDLWGQFKGGCRGKGCGRG